MDLLFGNDVHDQDGKLCNITQGPFGMDLVVEYALNAVKAGYLLWDAALPKFAHLFTAVNDLKLVLLSGETMSCTEYIPQQAVSKVTTKGDN